MSNTIIKTEQKALEINLNQGIYGTFAEIGAGQEVARNFFQVGAAAGTIAKTMSAYDKHYSDAIYGCDVHNRYVCENRLYRMLDHEYQLMEERLAMYQEERSFFVFADTVAAINYSKTIKGDGWMGLRFQAVPGEPPSEIILHARLLDNNNPQQQDAVGILGVNLLYACYYYRDDPQKMVLSLLDSIRGRVTIDMLTVDGSAFAHTDDKLLSLYLVQHGLTDVAILDQEGRSVHASEFLYKKSMMVVRGNFRPPTLVTADVLNCGFEQFKQEEHVDPHRCELLTEVTLDHLMRDDGVVSEQDYLTRVALLGAMGHRLIISNCSNHQALINYMSSYKIRQLGIVIGVHELLQIIDEKFEHNQDGRLLVAFGELFTQHIKVYAYPALRSMDSDWIMTADNLPVPEGIKFLYKHLLDSRHIVAIKGYDASLLDIFPFQVYDKIIHQQTGWEQDVPPFLASLIKERHLFDHAKVPHLV